MKGDEVNMQGVKETTGGWGTGWPWRVARAGLLSAGLAVAVAGCGSGSSHSPGVPAAAGTSTVSSTVVGSSNGNGLLAYSSCMRAHGVPTFPDPSGNGGIPKPAVVSALKAVGDTRAKAATDACNNLLPSGGLGPQSPTLTPQQEQDYLNGAACMRAHGFPGFPDPTFPNGQVSLSIPPSINTRSTQFAQAARTCARLIPDGLPYSHPGE